MDEVVKLAKYAKDKQRADPEVLQGFAESIARICASTPSTNLGSGSKIQLVDEDDDSDEVAAQVGGVNTHPNPTNEEAGDNTNSNNNDHESEVVVIGTSNLVDNNGDVNVNALGSDRNKDTNGSVGDRNTNDDALPAETSKAAAARAAAAASSSSNSNRPVQGRSTSASPA